MSSRIDPNNSFVLPAAPDNTQKLEVPEWLQNAGKVTKCVIGILSMIGAIGTTAIGITMGPFSSEIGVATASAALFLFGLAGYLIYSEMDAKVEPEQKEEPGSVEAKNSDPEALKHPKN